MIPIRLIVNILFIKINVTIINRYTVTSLNIEAFTIFRIVVYKSSSFHI